MNFLLEIKLRQEASRNFNPVKEGKMYDKRVNRRMKRKKIWKTILKK